LTRQPIGGVGEQTDGRCQRNCHHTTAPTITSPAPPITMPSQRGWRRIQSVHFPTCRRANVSNDRAQLNSVAQMLNPKKMTTQPGPGITSRTIPKMTTTRPAIATATRQATRPPGRRNTHARKPRRLRAPRLNMPFSSRRSGVDLRAKETSAVRMSGRSGRIKNATGLTTRKAMLIRAGVNPST
jgi:hypothetical protein